MKPEYDLKKMKIKRRGILPSMRAIKKDHTKVRITISLDKDIIDYFKSAAKAPGAFPYQTQLNQTLRQLIDKPDSGSDNVVGIKTKLLQDKVFIDALAKRIGRRS